MTIRTQKPVKLETSPASMATLRSARLQLSKYPCHYGLFVYDPHAHNNCLDTLTSTFRPRPVWEASLATALSTSTAQTLPDLPAPTFSLSAALATAPSPALIRQQRPLPQSPSLMALTPWLRVLVPSLPVSSHSCCELGYHVTSAGTVGH